MTKPKLILIGGLGVLFACLILVDVATSDNPSLVATAPSNPTASQSSPRLEITPDVARGMALESRRLLDSMLRDLIQFPQTQNDAPLKQLKSEAVKLHDAWYSVDLTSIEKERLQNYNYCGIAVGAIRTTVTKILSGAAVGPSESADVEKHFEQCKQQLN